MFQMYDAQFARENIPLALLHLERMSAMTKKIEMRIDLPASNQRNPGKLRDQQGNMLPDKLAALIAEQLFTRPVAIANHAALIQCQRRRLTPSGPHSILFLRNSTGSYTALTSDIAFAGLFHLVPPNMFWNCADLRRVQKLQQYRKQINKDEHISRNT
jgi:hypothetical protein